MKYPDVESVCYHIQNYMDLSKYNLKRITNEVNPKILTFVCSCICKKTIKEDDNISSSETITDSVTKRGNNLKGFIKRHNFESCSYRITFIKSENGEYWLKPKARNRHNHGKGEVNLIYLGIYQQIKEY